MLFPIEQALSQRVQGLAASSTERVKDSRARVTRSVFFQAVRRNHQRSMLKNYKDLKVWQKSYELCLEYGITAKFPKEERYGLTSQIRRSVVSIP